MISINNTFILIPKHIAIKLGRSYGILSFLVFLAFFNVHAQKCNYESPIKQPRGKLETSFKVMTTNIWGQHIDGIVDGLTPFNDGDCEDRHRRIGKFILNAQPEYDIIGFQEWHPDSKSTCSGGVLRSVIRSRYRTPTEGFYPAPKGSKWGQFRWGHPEAFSQTDGGNGLISKTPFLWETYDEDDFRRIVKVGQSNQFVPIPVKTKNVQQFTPSFDRGIRARSAHGFIFARIYLRYPDIAVDTYVVHLNSTGDSPNKCDLPCKQGMLKQLREGIHERSASSGFPVLIMGDFNIGGPNPENRTAQKCNGNEGYKDIMEQLAYPKDVWMEAHPNEPGTTHMGKTPQRIDFMFIPDDPYLVNSPFEITLKTPVTNQKKDWTVRIRDWNGDSDHHGLEAELEVRRKLSWATINSILH